MVRDKVEVLQGILISTPEFSKNINGFLYATFKAEIDGNVFEIKTSGKTLYYLNKINVGDEMIIHCKVDKYYDFFATFIRKFN